MPKQNPFSNAARFALFLAGTLPLSSLLAGPVVSGLVGSELDAALKGRVLIQELNCVACHASEASFAKHSKKAPRLAAIGSRVHPEAIERFIEDPHGTQPGTTMPQVMGNLDAVERKAAAKAITHFLLSGKKNTFARQVPDQVAARHGEKLFHSRGCVACHSPRDAAGAETLKNSSVSLGALDEKYSVKSLTDFLRRPQGVRPSGRMPDMRLQGQDAERIAHYLVRDTRVPGHLAFTQYRGKVWEGLESDAVEVVRAGQVKDFDLKHLGNVSQHTAVVTQGWLEVPQAGTYTFFLTMNGGSLRLADQEVVGEAPSDRRGTKKFQGSVEIQPGQHRIQLTYFHTGRKPTFSFEMEGPQFARGPIPSSMLSVSEQPLPAFKPLQVDPLLAEKGRKHFSDFGCANCHDDMQVTGPAAPAFARLDPNKGCLSERPNDCADYVLSAAQRTLMQLALPSLETRVLDAQEQIDTTLVRFNCIGCHDRTGLGLVDAIRKAHFSGTHPELGEQGRVPPPLTSVGAKVTAGWLREVLVKGQRQRPYLNASMPQYGEANVGHLIDLFKQVDRLEEVSLPQVGNILESKRAGYDMMGASGFSCIACHDFNGAGTGGAGALDLVHVTERIEKNWFHLYMLNPARFHPTVIMPSYWPGGQSTRPQVLAGDPAQQIEALWVYLQDGARAKKPVGLSRQSNEVRVADEVEMVRGRGTAGYRGIGVGYPERVNLAFDSEEMALRVLWKGAFASVNNGSFRTRGDAKISFPAGIPFHRLASMDDAWPYKGKTDHTFPQDHGYRYLGYGLDEERRPTFRYRYGGVTVSDLFEDVLDVDGKAFFRRTLRFETAKAQPTFTFRAAAGQQVRAQSDRNFKVDGLDLRITKGGVGSVRAGEPSEVLILLTLPAGRSTLTVEYQW